MDRQDQLNEFKTNGASEALLESQERYRTLFDLAPIAIYSCDASGVIQEYNKCAAELWGREPAGGIPMSGSVARSSYTAPMVVLCHTSSVPWAMC